jgi:hypothetical protein
MTTPRNEPVGRSPVYISYIHTHADVECATEPTKAIQRVLLNGNRVSYGYTLEKWTVGPYASDTKYGVLTVRSLTSTLVRVKSAGFNLCLIMAASRPCGSPAGLCYGGGCTYSVLSHQDKCCPVATVPTISGPP